MEKKEVEFYVNIMGSIRKATDFSLILDEWLRAEICVIVNGKYHFIHEDEHGISIGFTTEEAKKDCSNVFHFEREYKKRKRLLNKKQ